MPAIALLAPVALLLATAGAVAICGSAGWKVDRIVLGVGSLGAILVIVGLWARVRSSRELTLGQLGFGASFDLRLDAVSFVFSLMVLVPAAILLALQPRPWQETTVAVLGVAASVLAVESGGGLLTALAGGAAATPAVVQLDGGDPRAPRPARGVLFAPRVGFGWGGALLPGRSGTAVYAAVPGSARSPPPRVSRRGHSRPGRLCAYGDRSRHPARPGRRSGDAGRRRGCSRMPSPPARSRRCRVAGGYHGGRGLTAGPRLRRPSARPGGDL